MRLVLSLIGLLVCLQACVWDPPADRKLKLRNGSDKPVLVVYAVDDQSYHAINGLSDYNPFHEFQEADTTRGYRAGLLEDNPNYIGPSHTISANLGMGQWEDHIGKGKLRVYLFNPKTVLNNDWDGIRIGKKWDKMYSFTLNQIETMNWVISL